MGINSSAKRFGSATYYSLNDILMYLPSVMYTLNTTVILTLRRVWKIFHYHPVHMNSTSNLAVYRKPYSHWMNPEFRKMKV